MAYNPKHLVMMAHGSGQQWWSYRTTDAPAAVDGAGYFTGAAVAMLRVGDLIFVQQVDDAEQPGAVSAAGWHLVVSNDGATVDVTDASALSLTDSD